MSIKNKVIWLEGLVLEPQVFQQQEHYFEQLLQSKASLMKDNLWGFNEITLDDSVLSMGKFGIISASGIFPDGTLFDFPRTDQIPNPINITSAHNNTILYLALPLSTSVVADSGNENSQQAYRYHVLTKQVTNNMADSQEESDISVGSLACRILTEHDDRDNYMCLPMAKIQEIRVGNHVIFDKEFIPTWLNVQKSDVLRKFMEEANNLLHNRAEMLANRLTDTQQAGTADMVDLILLQLSNKYEAIFQNFRHASMIHPQEFYQYLTIMLAEMATYTTSKRRPIEYLPYQHQDLLATFTPIMKETRHALSLVLEQNATGIALQVQSHGLLIGHIHDKALITTCSFVLAVFADLPIENIRSSFPTQIKIAPQEKIQTLVSKALPGIGLQAIAVAPRQIPYHPNFCYFSLDTRSALWHELTTSAGVAIHISGNIPGLKLELWAIKG